ncbi:hypothetical protein [Amycolatopsis anabasis]|uniref:hypothetical protein n=1 Tax=Amycolatopsis anabasis TaxID=1840409 RepID=UPI00131AFE79|nr:hypothetical protein [Amycolatopsis anabasis]
MAGKPRGAQFWTAFATALIAVAAVVWFGLSWWTAEHDDGLRQGAVREEVLSAGRQGIATLNTLDYRRVDDGYRRWLDASTGALHDELAQNPDASKAKIGQAKAVSIGKVVDAAVTELDEDAGKAKVIAALETTVTPEGGQEVTKHNRFEAELTRTGAEWKLNAVGQVPVAEP